jgi:hypothetical protein
MMSEKPFAPASLSVRQTVSTRSALNPLEMKVLAPSMT